MDRAELLSEISRSMGGRCCDQRVVKTWINESAAMHDFVSGILESAPYNYTCNLTLGDEAGEEFGPTTLGARPEQADVPRSSRSTTAAPRSPAIRCSRSTLRAWATPSTSIPA